MFTDIQKALKSIPSDLLTETMKIVNIRSRRVIDDITRKQLFDKGEDGQGISLGTYALKTIVIKLEKGQPTNRVTLKDTGAFYRSFKLTTKGLITADDEKEDVALTERYGEDILVWSDENQDQFIKDILLGDLQNFIRKEIC